MNWYYADAGQQQGPVSEAELESLIQQGRVTQQTLVWREGMTDWQPCGQVREMATPQAPQPVLAPPADFASQPESDRVVCAECRGWFGRDQTIQYGNTHVCAACKPVFFQKLREGAGTALPAGEFNYAGFWIRAGAKILDGLIMAVVIGIPFLILAGVAGAAMNETQEPSPLFIGIQLLVQLVIIMLAIGYNTFFIGRFGATPGKMACGLKVLTPEGGQVSYLRALGRAFAEQLSGMICYIGYIMVAFDDQRRGLHDHICSTRVIRTR